jgi:hypothetical protein
MSEKIHFEVFLKKNQKAGWALFEARNERDDAIKLAHSVLRKNPGGSVRVTKERFCDSARTFRSVPVWESGEEQFKAEKDKPVEATLPCLTIDDLSKPHARESIKRALSSWLERHTALPLELLHRAELVEKLEASDTDMQHGIQKFAIARAQGSDASVHGYIKQLNDLIQQAVGRVYQDARSGKLPTYGKKDKFTEIAAKVQNRDNAAYLLRAAMADRLKSEKSFGDKLDALLEMAEELGEGELREFGLAEIDNFISEVISFESGRDALVGACDDLGQMLERLICLYDGDHGAGTLNLAPGTARRLARKISEDGFDATRSVIADGLLTGLEKRQRLRPSSVRDEVRLAREFAQKLVMEAGGAGLPLDALNAAFTARSARLLSADTIDEFLRHSRDCDEELERLLSLEENLVGEENKRKLAGYVRGLVGQHQTESHYIRGEGRPLERLAALTNHQARVLRGKYPDAEKAELAEAFDALGMKVIDESKILNAVEAGDRPALDKATGLLKLATAGALPIGDCSADAQARALRQLKSEMGLSEAQNDPSAKGKLRQIQTMLGQIQRQQ